MVAPARRRRQRVQGARHGLRARGPVRVRDRERGPGRARRRRGRAGAPARAEITAAGDARIVSLICSLPLVICATTVVPP